MAMKHLYKVYPQHVLRGILPKPIAAPTVLEGLNRQEFIKCFNGGEVYAIIDDKEIHITECNYEKAEKLFENSEDKNTVEVKSKIQHDAVNKNLKQYKTPEIHIAVEQATVSNDDETDAIDELEKSDEIDDNSDESKNDTNYSDEIPNVDAVSSPAEESETEILNTDDLKSEDVVNSTEVESDDTSAITDSEKDEVEIAGKAGNNLPQSKQYNKNHNNHSGQSNYRNHKHGNNNKGKFVINTSN